MNFFEDEKQFQEQLGEDFKNILGQSQKLENERINILKVKTVEDFTQILQARTEKELQQTFRLVALTEYKGFVADREFFVSMDRMLKFAKNDYYYGDPKDDFMDAETYMAYLDFMDKLSE